MVGTFDADHFLFYYIQFSTNAVKSMVLLVSFIEKKMISRCC